MRAPRTRHRRRPPRIAHQTPPPLHCASCAPHAEMTKCEVRHDGTRRHFRRGTAPSKQQPQRHARPHALQEAEVAPCEIGHLRARLSPEPPASACCGQRRHAHATTQKPAFLPPHTQRGCTPPSCRCHRRIVRHKAPTRSDSPLRRVRTQQRHRRTRPRRRHARRCRRRGTPTRSQIRRRRPRHRHCTRSSRPCAMIGRLLASALRAPARARVRCPSPPRHRRHAPQPLPRPHRQINARGGGGGGDRSPPVHRLLHRQRRMRAREPPHCAPHRLPSTQLLEHRMVAPPRVRCALCAYCAVE
eukprot:2225579-Pleurochrysis_carterae.AAC.7